MRSSTAALLALLAGFPFAASTQALASEPTLSVPVLDHAVAKGDLLAVSDFVSQEMPAVQAQAAPRLKEIVGMEAVRPLAAGTLVRTSDLIRPQLVRRGEPVTIALREGGLSITTAGRALGSGAAGDFVRIVSLSTNRTLDGIVESTGIVRVASH
jgi:flagellar basal body P-ring formation protein FlgA